jgi:NADH-quinone oxidoreductase subunit L
MVAAGVYMLCRVFFIFTPDALTVISWIGGFTALLAALIAVQQNDIKRILAYSTLSQLGYMVMGVGLHSPEAGMFHLTTHAFFKALLFLGAGSVIHAMHHEQDIWKMGALAKKMPVTFRTFMIGTLALAGFPGLSGFYSKDAILAAAHHHSMPLFILGVGVSALTTFYMFRLVFVTFYGPAKSHGVDHAHESPGVMIWPLIILAVLSVVAGVIGIEALFASDLKPGGEHPHGVLALLVYPFKHAPVAALSGLGAFAVGLFLAWKLYWNAK